MLKKNTAVTGFPIGHFINATTGETVTTGTPTCKRLLDGTGAAMANAASYNTDGGQWEIDLAQADTNGDVVGFSFTLTDCLPISTPFFTTTKLVSELQDLTAAQVNAEVDTAISDAALDDVPGLAIDIKSQVDIINVTCQNSVSAEMTERGYTSTRAGYIDRLDAAVTTRLASASYTAPANSDITAIKAKTDNLPASPAAVGSEMALADSAITAAKIAADAITEAKIADNAIATEHLAATAIQKIWDRLTSNLTTTGSIGKYIVDNSGGGGIEFTDTVDANPAANTVELAFRTILNNLDAAISAVGGTAGAGSIQYTDVVDDGTNPIDGVACWVTNDALGQDLVAGTVFTNANGEFTFMLDAGDYYLWLQKSGYNFPAEAFTVTAP